MWPPRMKDRRIRSNVVSPGPISTPLTNRQSSDVIARIVSTVPMGRIAYAFWPKAADTQTATKMTLRISSGFPA